MWITEEDRRWIAENLVLGNSPESMLDAMVHAGRDEAGARVAIMAAGTNPLIEGARRATERLERRLKKYEWLLRTSRQLSSAANASREVPEVSEINPEEFYRRFYFLNSPVVLTGCVSHWKAMETWRPARLSRRFGSQIVEVQSGRARVSDYERRAEQCARPMAFSDFIEAIATTRSNDLYMTARNAAANQGLLREMWSDVGAPPAFLDGSTPDPSGFLWFGPAGTITPTHHDLTNNLLVQVLGRKKVVLADMRATPDLYNDLHVFSRVDLSKPDLRRYPLAGDVDLIECQIGPGDALFIPIGWWHHVESMDVSISLTFTNFLEKNDFFLSYDSNGVL